MKKGLLVKDKYGQVGKIEEVFFRLDPAPKNKYHQSNRVEDAYLIKVNASHYIYRKRENIRMM